MLYAHMNSSGKYHFESKQLHHAISNHGSPSPISCACPWGTALSHRAGNPIFRQEFLLPLVQALPILSFALPSDLFST